MNGTNKHARELVNAMPITFTVFLLIFGQTALTEPKVVKGWYP
jgi:hypothetical protein